MAAQTKRAVRALKLGASRPRLDVQHALGLADARLEQVDSAAMKSPAVLCRKLYDRAVN